MTPQELIAAFDVLADAPDGVKRLRELVLSLAVRGKLVRQEAGDEPAVAFLGKPSQRVENPPFPLPEGWAWTSLSQLGAVAGGGTPSKANPRFWAGPIPWVSPKDMKVPRLADAQDHVSPEAVESSSVNLIAPGSILMVVRGMILAHSFPVAVTEVAVTINQDMKAITPFRTEVASYLLLLLQGSRDRVLRLVERSTHGTCKLPFQPLAAMPLAMPPLPEQHRIVARVDELMGLLDRLEAARTTRDAVRRQARDAALADLRNAPDAEAVEAAWARIAAHMDDLFTHPEDIAPLRQAVLQLAVRGRLVPTDDKAPLVEVRRAVQFLNGYAFKSEWYSKNGTRVVRNQNVGHGTLDWTDEKRVSTPIADEFSRFMLFAGDIVLSLDRPLISTGLKVARIRHEDLPCLLLQRVACPRAISDDVVLDYVYIWLTSSEFTDRIDPGRSNGVPHISTRAVESMLLRLPSVAEQHRIVARVDALLSLCDALEARLTAARDLHAQFAAAAVHHLDTPS